VQKFFRVSPFDTGRSLVTLLFPSVRSCIVCCGWITAPCLNCARRRPLCEEKDDDTTAYRHLSPRTVAEPSGVLFAREMSHQTNGFETPHPCLIGERGAYSNPMMRFLLAVSTTSLVTTLSSLATKTSSICIMRRSIKRILPRVMRRIAATASRSVKSSEDALMR